MYLRFSWGWNKFWKNINNENYEKDSKIDKGRVGYEELVEKKNWTVTTVEENKTNYFPVNKLLNSLIYLVQLLQFTVI